MPISWEDLQKVSGIRTPTAGRVTPVVDATPAQATQQPQNFVEKFNLLPALGAILGGGVGAFGGGPIGLAAGGAVGAGGGEALEQLLFNKPNIKGVVGEAALGAVGGPLGRLIGLPVKGAVNILTGSSRKLLATGLKISPTAFTKAAEAGVDLLKTYTKFAPKIGAGLDTQLGKIGGEFGGGGINKLLQEAEKMIQSSIKISGAAKRFTVQQLKSQLIEHKNLLTKIPGNESNIAELNDFITKTVSKYKGGLSAKQLLDIKRAADSKFGESVLKEEIGSVVAQGQKVLANAARGLLKGTYKNINKALGDEQELILLKKALEATRGKIEAGGIPSSIGGVLQSIVGPIGRRLPAVTGRLRREAAQPVIAGAEQAAFRGPLSILQGTGGGTPADQQLPSELDVNGLSTQVGAEEQEAPSPYPLENFLADIQRDPKNLSDYTQLYKLLNPQAGKKTASQEAGEEFLNKANNTIDSIAGSKKLGYGPATGRLYDFQVAVLGGAGLPPDVIALNQKYTVLKLNILRAYQGARISDKDFELANLYIPKLSDTEETAKTKLDVLKQLLTNAQPPQSQTTQSTTEQSDIFQMLGIQ